MKSKQWLFLALLLPVLALGWAMKNAASMRPELFVPQDGVRWVVVSPQGRSLLGWCSPGKEDDGYMSVWDAATARTRFHLKEGLYAKVSSDDAFLVVPDESKTDSVLRFNLFDIQNGKLVKVLSYQPKWQVSPDKPAWVDMLGFQLKPASSSLMIALNFGVVTLDMRSGRVISEQKWQLKGKTDSLGLTIGEFSPDSTLLIGYSHAEAKQQIYNVATGKYLYDLNLANLARFSPDSKYLWVENSPDSNDLLYTCYRLTDTKKMWSAPTLPVFSQDGKLAYLPSKSRLDVLDAHTGRKLRSLLGPLHGNFGNFDNFAPSPDGNYLYEARDGKIWKWRAR